MKTVSVIIPIYNHEKIIRTHVNRVLRLLKTIPEIHYELILINDGSTDNSRVELARFKDRAVSILHKKNGGLGSVVNMGFKKATGELLVIADLDFSYGENNIETLINLSEKWDSVFCSKYSSESDYPLLRRLGSLLLSLFLRFFLRIPVRDAGSGLVLLKSRLVDNVELISKGFGVHVELLILCKKQKARILEMPVAYKHYPGTFRPLYHGLRTLKELTKLIHFYYVRNSRYASPYC